MIYKYLLALGMATYCSPPLFAAADLQKIRQADKIAIALTGQPLTPVMKTKFINDQITLDGIADQLSASSDFIEYFAHFWSKVIGMQSPIDVYAMKNAKGQDLQNVLGRANWNGLGPADQPKFTVDYLTKYIASHENGPLELGIIQCTDAPLLVWGPSAGMINQLTRAAVDQLGPDEKIPLPIQAGTQALWQRLLDIAKETTAVCEDSNLVTVKPYWDPEKVTTHSRYAGVLNYKVPPKVLERCGAAMINCNLRNAQGFDAFLDEVGLDLSLEPAYLIAHTVAEDKPFNEILTTPTTIMTGTYAYFMAGQGKDLWANYPGGGIVDIAHPIFSPGNRLDRSHYRINRSPLHAGVLTTPAFQILTNGRRAKANRAYETFLCKKFTVPEGALADPSDSNPDLTKRAYCTYCHKSLEPMAAFFNRWPTTGNTQYVYDSSKTVVDTGRFNGSEGDGAPAFGKILAETDAFDECSIRRAFEFLNGRKMTSIELENKMPAYVADFKSSSKNLRATIKAMVLTPEFLSPKAGE